MALHTGCAPLCSQQDFESNSNHLQCVDHMADMASDLLVILSGILLTTKLWDNTRSLQVADLLQLLCADTRDRKMNNEKAFATLQIVSLQDCAETGTSILWEAVWKYAICWYERWPWVEQSPLLEDYLKQEKQNYRYCLLDIDMGVYSWSSFLPSKELDSFLNRAQKHTQMLAGMFRRLEHWNKAVKWFHNMEAQTVILP